MLLIACLAWAGEVQVVDPDDALTPTREAEIEAAGAAWPFASIALVDTSECSARARNWQFEGELR
jgi:hypothetical protein